MQLKYYITVKPQYSNILVLAQFDLKKKIEIKITVFQTKFWFLNNHDTWLLRKVNVFENKRIARIKQVLNRLPERIVFENLGLDVSAHYW